MYPVCVADLHAGSSVARLEEFLREKFWGRSGKGGVARLRPLLEEALGVARPRGVYRVCRVESTGEDSVVIEGRTFRSRVLAVNLRSVYRVFPFVVTCGSELEGWARLERGPLERAFAQAASLAILESSLGLLAERIQETHCPGGLSRMNPGSLEDWPLSEQKPLFDLLPAVEEQIGVRLRPDNLMEPVLSVSGLWFPAEQSFENCMLCGMNKCPGRRAPYDPGLYDRKYRKKPC